MYERAAGREDYLRGANIRDKACVRQNAPQANTHNPVWIQLKPRKLDLINVCC